MGLLTGDGLWSVAVLTVIFILLVDLMYRRQRWTARYPPGPMPLPLLGNLLQVDLKNMPYSLYKVKENDGGGSRGVVLLPALCGAEATDIQEEGLRWLGFLREGTVGLRTLNVPRTKTWEHNGQETGQDVTAGLGLVG